ncbi:hypothetical protein H0H87_007479 [Tephrocybe sp. NHM501043]|nr:hypothetical protein H0H87_007479 [Tephrocybe sp. NHM501043]
MRQAEALASSFASTKLTAIHSSPLERALLTAKALQEGQSNFVPLEASPLLCEQNFGQGEGQSYDVRKRPGLSFDEHIAQGLYIRAYNRSDKYPDGESLNDVARRARNVIDDIIFPYVTRAAKEGTTDMHVAFVSHSIFIAELIAELVIRDGNKFEPIHRGLKNTGWTLVTIKVAVGYLLDRS